MSNPHEKLIAGAAKEILGPLGFHRKGHSRTWIADHGWWLNVVEFQPSGWAKGSYLNVAAHWLWIEQDYLSFDYCGRVESFSKYTSDMHFQPEASRLAQTAAKEAHELGQTFDSIEAAAMVLCAKERDLPQQARGGWSAYHAGMALGLSGRLCDAATLFHSVRDDRVQPVVARVEKLLADPVEFRREVGDLIDAHRRALGLSPHLMSIKP